MCNVFCTAPCEWVATTDSLYPVQLLSWYAGCLKGCKPLNTISFLFFMPDQYGKKWSFNVRVFLVLLLLTNNLQNFYIERCYFYDVYWYNMWWRLVSVPWTAFVLSLVIFWQYGRLPSTLRISVCFLGVWSRFRCSSGHRRGSFWRLSKH